MAKSLRGIGFKDLCIFNDVLLAKQSWRLMMDPNGLWVKVMKGIYFHNKDFLDVGRGGRASWAWSSLILGREVLKENAMWQVMDGRRVSIWNDNWILGLDGRKLGHPRMLDFQIPKKVDEIMDKRKGERILGKIEQ